MCKRISKITGEKWGKDECIRSREMGQSGTDVCLIDGSIAAEMFPFSIECKNTEKWNIPEYIKQAKQNQKEGTDWMLVVKRNNAEPVIIMDADAFMDFYQQYIRFVWF
jgi:hypothetical protein